MKLVGLDAAKTSGAAVLDGDRLVIAVSYRPDADDHADVFRKWRTWWDGFLDRHEPECVALEEPLRTDLGREEMIDGRNGPMKIKKPIGTMRTFEMLYGLRAHAIELCSRKKIRCIEVNNKTWRSKVYGKGTSPPKDVRDRSRWWKQQALDRCSFLGWPVTQPDAAESAMIAEYLRIRQKEERLGIVETPNQDDLFAAWGGYHADRQHDQSIHRLRQGG